MSTSGQRHGAYGFSNEHSTTTTTNTHQSYNNGNYEWHGELNSNRGRQNHRSVITDGQKRSSSGSRLYDRTIWVQDKDLGEDIAVYQSVKKDNNNMAASSHLRRHSEEILTSSSHRTIHTDEETMKTEVKNVQLKKATASTASTSRIEDKSYANLCQCCLAHNHFNAAMVNSNQAIEALQYMDSSCQTDLLPLPSTKEIQRTSAFFRNDQSTSQMQAGGLQGVTQTRSFYVKSTKPAPLVIDSSQWELHNVSQLNENRIKHEVPSKMVHTKAEEQSLKRAEGYGFENKGMIENCHYGTNASTQSQRRVTENSFSPSASGIEVQEGTLWLQSDGEEEMSTSSSTINGRFDTLGKKMQLKETDDTDEIYEIRTEWIPDVADTKYVTSFAKQIPNEENYSVSLDQGKMFDEAEAQQSGSHSFLTVKTATTGNNSGKIEKKAWTLEMNEKLSRENGQGIPLDEKKVILEDVQGRFVIHHENGHGILLQEGNSDSSVKRIEKVQHNGHPFMVGTVGCLEKEDASYAANTGGGANMNAQREVGFVSSTRSSSSHAAASLTKSSDQGVDVNVNPVSSKIGERNPKCLEYARVRVLVDQKPNVEQGNSFCETSTLKHDWKSEKGVGVNIENLSEMSDWSTEHIVSREKILASRFTKDSMQRKEEQVEMKEKHIIGQEKIQLTEVQSDETLKLVSTGAENHSVDGDTVFYKPGGIMYRYILRKYMY